jgi:hypothetical protein
MSLLQLKNLLKSPPDSPLQRLLRQANDRQRLTERLKAGLEPGLASQLSAANLRQDGQLVLIASSPAWAARLRFESEKILELARSGGAEVRSCRVIVAKS